MNDVRVRRAVVADYPTIRDFLQREWDPNHVFVKNPSLFMWQHLESDTGYLNFLVLEVGDKIQSLLGYVPFRKWSKSVSRNCVFLAIWKTAETCTVPGAGIHLLKQIPNITGADFVGAIGISSIALPIYKRLGYETGLMDHFVIFNSKPAQGLIQRAPNLEIARGKTQLRRISFYLDAPLLDEVCASNNSSKNAEYLLARYGQHPKYSYELQLLELEDAKVVLVTRCIQVQESFVCRIVDAVGDFSVIEKSAGALRKLVEEQGFEYIDIYSFGLDKEGMVAGGFFSRTPESSVVIPNHFEPLVMKNTELAFAWKNLRSNEPIVFFRGDSDQDRPNS